MNLFAIGGNVTCAQTSLDVALTANIGGTTIAGRLNALSFGSCTGTMGGLSFAGCGLHSTAALQLRSNATGGAFDVGATVLRCPITSSTLACYYNWPRRTLTYANATGALTIPSFSGATPASTTGDAAPTSSCAPTGVVLISGTVTHLVDQSGHTVTVTTS